MKKANYANIDCYAMRVPSGIWEQKSSLFLTALVYTKYEIILTDIPNKDICIYIEK